MKQIITALELLFRALRECTDLQFATLFRGPWVQGGPTDPECPESVKRNLAREYLVSLDYCYAMVERVHLSTV